MPLLNYTTQVPVRRSIDVVQGHLVKAGARRIMVEYDDDKLPMGVAFTINTDAAERAFHLPIEWRRVHEVLLRDRSVPARFQTEEHAQRVAWRIIKDWLEAQLAIVATEMVSFEQVMLPYMAGEGGRTMWELYLDHQLALGKGD